jgi:UDP-N-acetylmuramoyl-tripeptide--D-alanyl-D-alanine ligase
VIGEGAPLLFAAVGPARLHQGVAWITVGCGLVACVPAGLRWLRVAQREHYLAGSVSRFAGRWWVSSAANLGLAVLAVAAAGVSVSWPLLGVVTAAVVAFGPLGLTVRGRTAPLVWTRRLRTLATVSAVLVILVMVFGLVSGLASPLALVAALIVPVLVDLACAVTAPIEHRMSESFVEAAAARLQRVDPCVVAVTGSYGKTSTKSHIAHLVRPGRTVVATPASFNNRVGLARAVNEHLADGTEVFVAEMGTYGPGEIAALCRWCPPDIAVITAIGPVHLERFGSEERIVEAKSEIIDRAATVVLQVDDKRLAVLADRAAADGKRVLRCSAVDPAADVFVERGLDGSRLSVKTGGRRLAEGVVVTPGVQPTNLACAIAVGLALGVEPDELVARLGSLPPVEHRLEAVRAATGVTILDDTYNANPAGAAEALAMLGRGPQDREPVAPPTPSAGPSITSAGPSTTSAGPPGAPDGSADSPVPHRRVVVTPGMVELGPRQAAENRHFAAACAGVATDLLVVGRTNRRALMTGATSESGSPLRVRPVRRRDQAVAWVRQNLGSGDAVLYENDLPDHYP